MKDPFFLFYFKFNAKHFTHRLEPRKIFPEMVFPVRMEEFGKVAADDFVTGVSEYFEPGVIHIKEIAVLIQGLITQRGVFKQGPEFVFVFPQRLDIFDCFV